MTEVSSKPCCGSSQKAQKDKIKVNNSEQSYQLIISGANCAGCVKKIETALTKLDGVESAIMNFPQRTVDITGLIMLMC